MTNPAESGDESDEILNAVSNSTTKDRESQPTLVYRQDPNAELVVSDLDVVSGELPVPARLGKYEIRGEVGRGGMGVVLKGFDPDLLRTVAIKVLSPHLAQSEVARRRFQREARAAAAINHENVLTIHSVEEQGETPFLVMEFVAGKSLKEHIGERSKLDVIEVIRLSAQVAQGLAAAHVQGVIHRDVKPANVMLHEGATRVRLMDFGLARVAFDNSDLTSHDHTVGTPAYMAPEQIRGQKIDARADLFSLGCVMYCMIVGHSPFHGRNHVETIHKIIELVPTRLHAIHPAVPLVLSDMVDKLLAKHPDDRYQSAFEVADVLSRLLAQLNQTPTDQLLEVFSDRISLAPEKARVAGQRNEGESAASRRWPVIAAALTFLLAVGFTGWNYWPDRQTTRLPLVGENGGPTKVLANSVSTPNGTDPLREPLLTEITVGPGAEATCATLKDAIARAAENCTITVVGPGPYTEPLLIDRPELRGLKLIAKSRVKLGKADGSARQSHLLDITNVSNVTVSGFDFELTGEAASALVLTGSASDITVTDCQFIHTGSDAVRSLVSIAATATEPAGLIRFERCQFLASGGAFCLSANAGSKPPPNLNCEDCLFIAPFTQIYISQSCRQIRLARNVFYRGENAINLNFKAWLPDSRVEIVNNTFAGTRFWLGFYDSFRSDSVPVAVTNSRVCNNLILGGERVQAGRDQLDLVRAKWRCEANWWEQDTTTVQSEDAGSLLVTYHPKLDIPVRDDRRDEQFLLPPAGSPLLTAGVGGDLPRYIGAKSRADSP